MRRVRIHQEGKIILTCLLVVLCLINIPLWLLLGSSPVVFVNLIISVVVLCYFVYFFRNPRRIVTIGDPSTLISPADGKIVVIEPTMEDEYFHEKRLQVSIFMSLISVHANWYPLSGIVKYVRHHAGSHSVAYAPKSSKENEHSSIVIESEDGRQILMKQIAGVLAQRIVTYAKEGHPCVINEHLGFIKFGSRVDLFLPLDTELYVKLGEKVRGNETIIGKLK
ncbi:MAG: phosphatidylserine decarboxylase family protein [Paludibacteraceae bacterium]|nr:phosphatidylserine decarboxylase family protein [Paludibacteraceae bacterium]